MDFQDTWDEVNDNLVFGMYVSNWFIFLRLWEFAFNLKALFIKSGDSPSRYLKTLVIKKFITFDE